MTQVFQYYKVVGFPLIDLASSWNSLIQLGLPNSKSDSTEHSIIRNLGESEHVHFKKLHVKHENTRAQKVRFDEEERNSVIFIEDFDIFLVENYSYLYAATRSKNCTELFNRIKQKEENFNYYRRIVDLSRMKSELPQTITGGWFKDLGIADVQTAAIFGNSVGESDEWQKYEDSGTLSALVISFTYKGKPTTIQISKTGSMVLYQRMVENDYIDLCESINEIVMRFSEEKLVFKSN